MPSSVHDSGVWMKKSEHPHRFSTPKPLPWAVIARDGYGDELFVADHCKSLEDALQYCIDAEDEVETWPAEVACYDVRRRKPSDNL